MKFKTTDELMEFMNTIDLEKSTLVFKSGEGEVTVSEEDAGCGCAGEENVCSCSTVAVTEQASATIVEPNQVLVESFSDVPSLNLVISEDDNKFFVKDFDAMRDACGTGSITLEDRVAYMNMCEMDNVATVTLDIVTEGKRLKGVPFTLIKTEGESYLQLCKAQLL